MIIEIIYRKITFTRIPIVVFILFFLVFNISICHSMGSAKKFTNKRVIVVVPIVIDAINDFIKGVEDVVKPQKVSFEYLSAEGDPSRFETAIKSGILKKPDVLIIFGSQMSDIAVGSKFRTDLPPTIVSALTKPEKVAGLMEIGVNPPRKLPVGIISDSPKISYYKVAGELFSELIGKNKIIGILYTKSDLNSEITAENLAKELMEIGNTVEMGVLTAAEDVSKVTKSLILKGVDAIFLPHDKNVLIKAPTVVKLGIESENKKVPVFSLDEGTVREKGVVASASVSYYRVGKMTGEMALEIIGGKDASRIPVKSAEKADIYVNDTNRKKFNIIMPENLRKKAIIFDSQ